MKNINNFMPTLFMGLGLALQLNTAAAADGAEWWQWVNSIPPVDSPFSDSTGEKCMVGQRGNTWYLAGTFINEGNAQAKVAEITPTSSISCTIPQGKTIFFPIYNYINFNTPGVCGQGETNLTVIGMRKSSADHVNMVKKSSISLYVDGKKYAYNRKVSPVFELTLPEDNIWDAGCSPDGVPGGVYSAAVDDGYYAQVTNLQPGEHTIEYYVTDDNGIYHNNKYYITIVKTRKF